MKPAEHAPASPKATRSMAWFMLLVAIAAAAVAAIIIFRVVGGSSSHKGVAITSAAQVTISHAGFNPASIRVQAGTTVTWANQDTSPHQVQGDQKSLARDFSSGQSLGRGDTYSYTFRTKGTYNYHDTLNPTTIKGIVIVE